MKSLIAIILLATIAFAQQKTPPPPGAARPLNLPKITEKKLANGLTVVLAPLPNVPKISSILTFRSATTATDRAARPGIAQIAAAVANEGTDTRTSKQIKEELRSIGGDALTRQRCRFDNHGRLFALGILYPPVRSHERPCRRLEEGQGPGNAVWRSDDVRRGGQRHHEVKTIPQITQTNP